MANLEAIFQKFSHSPLLKFVFCAKRGPSFGSPPLKSAPSSPEVSKPSTAEIKALWTRGRLRLSGFFPSILMMYGDTEAWKYLQHHLELCSGWFWEASPLLPTGSTALAVSHHGHVATLEKHFQKEPKFSLYIYVYIHIYVYTYTHTRIYMYICLPIYTHIG